MGRVVLMKDTVLIREKNPEISKRILLFGYIGLGNVGAEIRLKVIVDEIRRARPDGEITILSFKVFRSDIDGVKFVYIDDVFSEIPMVLDMIQKSDYLVCTEGIPFESVWGKGMLEYHWFIFFFGHIFKKKLISYSFDIDNLTRTEFMITKYVLENTDYLVSRTRDSCNMLKKIGLKHKIYLGSDCALRFHPDAKKAIRDVKHNLKKSTGTEMIETRKIGFCLKDYFGFPIKYRFFFKDKKEEFHDPFYFTYTKKGRAKRHDFIVQLSKMLNELLSDDGNLKIQLIVMELEADMQITREVYSRIHSKERIEIISMKNRTLEEIKLNFSDMDCLITTRLHALLLSLEYMIPVLSLSSDERLKYTLHEIGLRDYICEVRSAEVDEIIFKIRQFIDEQESNKVSFRKILRSTYKSFYLKSSKNYKYLKKFLG